MSRRRRKRKRRKPKGEEKDKKKSLKKSGFKKQYSKKTDKRSAKTKGKVGGTEKKKSQTDRNNKKTKKEKKPKKENKIIKNLKTLWKERGIEGITELIKEIAKIVGGLLSSVFRNIVIKKLDLNITVAYEDAADTAVKYGYACAGIYPAMAVILRVFKYKDYNIIIVPDFDKKSNEITVDTEISLIPWFVIAGAVKAAFRLIKLKVRGMI